MVICLMASLYRDAGTLSLVFGTAESPIRYSRACLWPFWRIPVLRPLRFLAGPCRQASARMGFKCRGDKYHPLSVRPIQPHFQHWGRRTANTASAGCWLNANVTFTLVYPKALVAYFMDETYVQWPLGVPGRRRRAHCHFSLLLVTCIPFLGKILNKREEWRIRDSSTRIKRPPMVARLLFKREGRCRLTLNTVKYRNNVIEYDHGKLKRIIGATLGFKSMKTAYATIKVLVMLALRKGRASHFIMVIPGRNARKQSF